MTIKTAEIMFNWCDFEKNEGKDGNYVETKEAEIIKTNIPKKNKQIKPRVLYDLSESIYR